MGKQNTTISLSVLKKKIDDANLFKTQIFGNSLLLYRDYNGRQITTTLKKNTEGLFEFKSNYVFVNRNSHYTYSSQEQRYNRNKGVLISIIKKLKESRVWDYIDKSFLVINKNNKNVRGKKRRELESQLKDLKASL